MKATTQVKAPWWTGCAVAISIAGIAAIIGFMGIMYVIYG